MREERSLHANVSGVGHHILFADFFLCIVFTYFLIFYFHLPPAACGGRVVFKWIPVLINRLSVSDSRLPRGIRPSVRHVVLHPGYYFRLSVRSDPSPDCTGSDPAIASDAHR